MSEYSLDELLKSCRMEEPLRLRVTSADDPAIDYVKALHHPFAVVGRHFRADLPLDHEAVSRRHAYLQVIQGRVFCVDLESRTGVRWDGKPATSGWLDPGTPIHVGPLRIELLRGARRGRTGLPMLAAPTDPMAVPPADQRVEPALALDFVNRTGGPVSLPLDRCLSLLGKAASCRPRFTDSSASRFQCSLLRTPEGLWIVDLLGRGGVHVNRALVRFARLEHGDELRLARYIFRVRQDPPPGGAGAAEPTLPAVRPHPAPPAEARGSASPACMPEAAAMAFPTAWTQVEAPAAVSDAQLLPLVQQFGQMQQQMFDQFQQAMIMMFQMFGTLHREQFGAVQEELEHIRRLTEQLAALQASPGLAARSDASELATPPFASPRADTPTARGGSQGGPQTLLGGLLPPNRHPSDGASEPGARPQEPALSGAPWSSNARMSQAEPPAENQTASDGAAVPTDEAIHALLWQRIAEIQNERQTRWQKIMSLVTGN